MALISKHPLISILVIFLSIGVLAGQDLSRFYCSPLTPETEGINTLTNGGAYLDLWYVNGMGGLSMVNSTMYTLEGDWAKALIPELPMHEYVGYQGFFYVPIKSGETTRETRNLMVNPIFYPDAGASPTPQKLIICEEDPAGDQLLGSGNLDILGTRVGFSETKLYFAMRNNATSFPVSSGINFFSYMFVLADPDTDPETNPTVYGLMYTVDVAGVISPGLYKITGTGLSDQTRIGDILTSIDSQSGTLSMSCDLADLMADADFASWYNPAYPVLAVVAMTSRINLTSGVQTSDVTPGGKVVLLPKQLTWQDDSPAVVSTPVTAYSEGSLSFSCNYFDADGNFPSTVTWSVDGSAEQVMRPVMVTGFEDSVLFVGEPINTIPGWQACRVSYTVGNQSFTQTFENPSSVHDEVVAPVILSYYPNPVRDRLHYRQSGVKGDSELRLYNLRGELVKRVRPLREDGEVDLVDLQHGVYILQVGDYRNRILKY